MEWLKYDRITDDVCDIGQNFVLRFSVVLSNRAQDGQRNHFYKEYEYESRCKGESTAITVRRSYTFYLSIENKRKVDGEKLQIRIFPRNFLLLKSAFDTAISWFIDKRHNGLFMLVDGELAIKQIVPSHTVSGFENNKTIKMFPSIVFKGTNASNGHRESGITMEFSDGQVTQLTLDDLMEISYLYGSFNMYQSAQIMVNYIEKPTPGTNRYNILPAGNQYNPSKHTLKDTSKESEKTTSINGRKKPKGKYSNISDLE